MKKKALLTIVFGSLIVLSSYAEELRITVCDGELEMPLEGAKIFLNENRSVSVETDMDGKAVLDLGEKFEQGNVVCQFPGYSQNVTHIKSGAGEIIIAMMISDFLEGKEIVVARSAQKNEQQSGVSVVMTKEQMDTTARTGLVEDVMSSVNTMPGMTFGGQWNSEPSVRGGYPREMSYAMDGVYVMFPWHWGGSYSIFSPNFVESTKLSNGVFSAEYGRAVSGLLEVNTVMPDDELHFIFDLNYISSSLFLSTPIGKKAGIVLGAKATYLETLVGTYKALGGTAADMLEAPPYIRDFFAKGYYQPTDKLTFTVNGFFGSDGMHINMDKDDVESDDEVISFGEMKYDVYQGIVGLGANWMPTDKVQANARFAWSMMYEDLSMKMKDQGEIHYNKDFIEKWGSQFPSVHEGGSYNLDTFSDYYEKVNHQMVQGKIDSEVVLNDFSRIKFGAEEVLAFQTTKENGYMWSEVDFGNAPYPSYMPFKFSIEAEGIKTFNTAAFALWNYGTDESLLSGELGLRAEHALLTGDGIDLNSRVDVNPRATVHVTPWRDLGEISKVTFTAGAGLFSAIPFDAVMVSEDVIINDKLKMDRVLFGVLGSEIEMKNNWKFSVEGYYKHYLNRLYVINDMRNPLDVTAEAVMDGKGYTAGFDLMAQKSIGEKWNGYLTYSFIYAKYKNPRKAEYPDQTSSRGDPLNEWYFPSFHRFNTLNLIVNYKPVPTWTITVKGTLATGTPRTDGERYCYPAMGPDGQIMQRYTRSHFYSDTLRTDISCPVDIRIAHNGTFKNHPKWNWEWYLGAEDVFMNLYSPKTSERFDQTTGKATSSDANFGIGIPMISLGCRISY